jgi:hypothetical protein
MRDEYTDVASCVLMLTDSLAIVLRHERRARRKGCTSFASRRRALCWSHANQPRARPAVTNHRNSLPLRVSAPTRVRN